FWMYARSGPYSYCILVGGTVSLCPLQLRFSNRVLRPRIYSVLLVGMSPKRLSVWNFRLALNIEILGPDYQASVLLVAAGNLGYPETARLRIGLSCRVWDRAPVNVSPPVVKSP